MPRWPARRKKSVGGAKRGPKPGAKLSDLQALETRVFAVLLPIAKAVGAELTIAPEPGVVAPVPLVSHPPLGTDPRSADGLPADADEVDDAASTTAEG